MDAQQLSGGEDRACLKRNASAAELKGPAALTGGLDRLPAPPGPLLRRYKVQVGTGLGCGGSAPVSAAGGCISSSDSPVGVAAVDDFLSPGLDRTVGDVVQVGELNLVSSGSGLAGVDVVVSSSAVLASVPSVASMCPADSVVREATPVGCAVSEGGVTVGSSADAVQVDALVVAAESASSGGCRVASGGAALDGAQRSKTAAAAESRQALNEIRGIGNLHTLGAKGKEVFGSNRVQQLRDALRQSRAACIRKESAKAESMKLQDNINAATKNAERDESSSATGTGGFNPDVDAPAVAAHAASSGGCRVASRVVAGSALDWAAGNFEGGVRVDELSRY